MGKTRSDVTSLVILKVKGVVLFAAEVKKKIIKIYSKSIYFRFASCSSFLERSKDGSKMMSEYLERSVFLVWRG